MIREDEYSDSYEDVLDSYGGDYDFSEEEYIVDSDSSRHNSFRHSNTSFSGLNSKLKDLGLQHLESPILDMDDRHLYKNPNQSRSYITPQDSPFRKQTSTGDMKRLDHLRVDTKFDSAPESRTVKTFRIGESRQNQSPYVPQVAGSEPMNIHPNNSASSLHRALSPQLTPTLPAPSAQEMMPSLPQFGFNGSNSQLQKIISEAARKQQEAQSLFRSFAVKEDEKIPPEHVLLMHPTVTPSEAEEFSIPPPPSAEPDIEALQRVGSRQFETRQHGQTRQQPPQIDTRMNPPAQRMDPRQINQSPMNPFPVNGMSQPQYPPRMQSERSIEDISRNERLASLGIFNVNPKASRKLTPNQVAQLPIQSFATPYHEKPQFIGSDIERITAPRLVSTSSRIQTVPISEIKKDLIAAGRLVEDEIDLKKSNSKSKKKGFFKDKEEIPYYKDKDQADREKKGFFK
ncbi:hypothetical protein HDV01_001408 [Terramyces sp. JEL0728]|nr:hypothetical protein HDV01_001408 [Terramyces sp. JEL0728]